MRLYLYASLASLIFLSGCGFATGSAWSAATPGGQLGAQSTGEMGIDLSTAYKDAVALLRRQHPGAQPRLLSIANSDLNRQGSALGGDGWLLDFADASGSYGVQVKADGSVSTYGVGGSLPEPFDPGGVNASHLITLAFPDPSQQGPFGLTLETDAEANGPVALVGIGEARSQAIWATSGQPYAPVRPEVAAHLASNLQRCLAAHWDATLGGAQSAPAAYLEEVGLINPAQAQALDPSRTGSVERAAYVSMASWPSALFNFDILVGNSFGFATGGSGSMTASQRSFDVSLGAKVTPGKPLPQPFILRVAISSTAFAAADTDGDGRLSLSEAMVPLADALGNAFLSSPEALAQGASFTADALPWAHY